MPARSRWRQRRGLRRSCTLRTRQRQPPQRGMLVVGSTSQTRPVSVNSTALTKVNVIPSTELSRVVARMVVGAPKVGLRTAEVPLRPCAFHNHSFSPTSYQPIPAEFRHPATRSRPRGFHQTYQRAELAQCRRWLSFSGRRLLAIRLSLNFAPSRRRSEALAREKLREEREFIARVA